MQTLRTLGAMVRKLIGFDRLEGLTATAALRRVYDGPGLYIKRLPAVVKTEVQGEER
jgi:hypothetical protein